MLFAGSDMAQERGFLELYQVIRQQLKLNLCQ